MPLKPVEEGLFFSKSDPHDPRLGGLTQKISSNEKQSEGFIVVGYPDDEGIKINGGRVGAAHGPTSIRKIFYRMTPSLNGKNPKIFDGGNLEISGSLEERHREATTVISNFLRQDLKVMTLGGGHDYGFSDCEAFVEDTLRRKRRPFIVNFDAHLDVRPDDKGENSGTPFYQLLKKYSDKMDFFEVGIQDWCNSREHLAWAKERGAKIISLDDILSSGLALHEILQKNVFQHFGRGHDLAISLDIDAFCPGPGASQIFPVGLDANDFLSAWKAIVAQFKPRLLGIYEVSPPLDLDDRTSRLAAIFLHQFIFAQT
jgi:formiminoglutamase